MINRNQITAIGVTAMVLLAILMFPPFAVETGGETKNMGYAFVFSPPRQSPLATTVNATQLFIQWLAIMLYGSLAFILAKETGSTGGYSEIPAEVSAIQPFDADPAHPWIRLWARLIDYALFLACFYALVFALSANGAHMRFSENLAVEFLLWPMVANALLVFYEALCLSTLATTPGKALFSIQVLSRDGARLSFSRALGRAFAVLWRGFAFLLLFPVIPSITLWAAYKEIRDTGSAQWDKADENWVTHGPLGDIRVVIGAMAGVLAAVSVSSAPVAIRLAVHKQPLELPALARELPAWAARIRPQPPSPTPQMPTETPQGGSPAKEPAVAAPKNPPVAGQPAPNPAKPPPDYSNPPRQTETGHPSRPASLPPTILEAVKAKDVSALKEFIRQGRSLNERIDGTTLLIVAVKAGNADMVRWLIERGADINQADADGRVPYLFAQAADNQEIMSLLGANQGSGASVIPRWRHEGDKWILNR